MKKDYVETKHLKHEAFRDNRTYEFGNLNASAFTYGSGVEGLKIGNESGFLVVLPFQGQQIWEANFLGRDMGMESAVYDPVKGKDYLKGYGAFLVHCGARRMGCPGPEDDHPLHGDLPNAGYKNVILTKGIDNHGWYMEVSGNFHHRKKDQFDYIAHPKVRLYAGHSIMGIQMNIINLFDGPMELMYLAHANFQGIPGSELVYSAPCTPETVHVRTKDPAHAPPPKELIRLRNRIINDPSIHNIIPKKPIYDPEVVMGLEYKADEAGWAHSMQVRPDGNADYFSFRPNEFPMAVRWMRMVAEQDPNFPVMNALGLVLPSTSGVTGYTAEKAAGTVQKIRKRGKRQFSMIAGILPPNGVSKMRKTIEDIMKE